MKKETFMKVRKMRWLFARGILIAILNACSTPQPIPNLLQPQSSGLGIEMTLRTPLRIFSNSPSEVYFAKIDGEGGVLQESVVHSNFTKNERAYLLNAQPGTYVAVAAYCFRAPNPFQVPPLSSGAASRSKGKTSFTTYFSKELIDKTRVTIGTNDFAFMGSYVVDQSIGFTGADTVQIHYQKVIAPGALTGGLYYMMGGDFHYLGTLNEGKNDEHARNEFIRNAREDLAGSGWAGQVK
jgi:hypothetical protein